MLNDADRVVATLLRADDDFLIEVGRLTLLFSHIEDILAQDALYLLQVSGDEELKNIAASTPITGLRILEKRDFLKLVVAEMGRYYDVDHTGVCRVLDEFGNINRLRRTVVHGWIRWSGVGEKPVFVDSRGHSSPAWTEDLMNLNLKVLSWIKEYYAEQKALGQAVLCAYDRFADRLLQHPKLSAEFQSQLRALKSEWAAWPPRDDPDVDA